MSTYSVTFDLEPEIKEQADRLLDRMGMSLSKLMSQVLQKMVAGQDIHFDLDNSTGKSRHLSMDSLTDEQFDSIMQEAMDEFRAGNFYTVEEVRAEFAKGLRE